MSNKTSNDWVRQLYEEDEDDEEQQQLLLISFAQKYYYYYEFYDNKKLFPLFLILFAFLITPFAKGE